MLPRHSATVSDGRHTADSYRCWQYSRCQTSRSARARAWNGRRSMFTLRWIAASVETSNVAASLQSPEGPTPTVSYSWSQPEESRAGVWGCPSRDSSGRIVLCLSSQPVQQCLGLLQVCRVKSLGEPIVDGRQQSTGFLPLALVLPQLTQTPGCPQLPRFRLLTASDVEGPTKTSLGLMLVWGGLQK